MKNKNIVSTKVILFIFSLLVGVLVSTQIEANTIAANSEDVKSAEDYLSQIDRSQDDIRKLNEMIKDKEKELRLLMESDNDNNIINLLKEDIKTNKIYSGFSNMEGPGIEIIMYDNMEYDIIGLDINDDIIHDIDILNILNDLKVAGAEALSINNQRVISTTEIKCGGPIIRINGKSYATPFIIRAIGDPSQLMAAVTAPGTYGDILKNVYQLHFEAAINENIFLPSYDGDLSYTYAQPMEVGE